MTTYTPEQILVFLVILFTSSIVMAQEQPCEYQSCTHTSTECSFRDDEEDQCYEIHHCEEKRTYEKFDENGDKYFVDKTLYCIRRDPMFFYITLEGAK